MNIRLSAIFSGIIFALIITALQSIKLILYKRTSANSTSPINSVIQKKGEFLIGTLGYQDVHCQTINLTYVKTESAELHTCLLENVRQFVQQYNSGNKTLTLEAEEILWKFLNNLNRPLLRLIDSSWFFFDFISSWK